jgi:hypothetical protein
MVERYFDPIDLTFSSLFKDSPSAFVQSTFAAGIRLKDIRASHISPKDIRIFDTS